MSRLEYIYDAFFVKIFIFGLTIVVSFKNESILNCVAFNISLYANDLYYDWPSSTSVVQAQCWIGVDM